MVVALLMALAFCGGQSVDAKFYSYVNGERWEFQVTGIDLAKAPAWDATEEAPPLAPRAAVRAAREMLRKLLPDGAAKWEFGRLSLQPVAGSVDAWVYLVDFTSQPPLPPHFTPGASGVVGSFISLQVTLPVLMDGTALTPARTPWRSR